MPSFRLPFQTAFAVRLVKFEIWIDGKLELVAIPVTEGQAITQGQVLLVLESMKMQNELKAPRDGTVSRIRVKVGETVEQKQTLLNVM